MDIIQQLAKSGNKLLEAAANDMSQWQQLKHNKQDLELFLQFNLVNLRFKPKNKHSMQEIVCTSNTKFIEVFSKLKKSEKQKALKLKNNGIRTNEPNSVLTYNIITNRYNTIDLSAWEIVNFISMTEDNIEILDDVLNTIMRKQIVDDLK
jgi:hypothetical protein